MSVEHEDFMERLKRDSKRQYCCEKCGIIESIPAHVKHGCTGPWIVKKEEVVRDE